jgi:hypothetical protein
MTPTPDDAIRPGSADDLAPLLVKLLVGDPLTPEERRELVLGVLKLWRTLATLGGRPPTGSAT